MLSFLGKFIKGFIRGVLLTILFVGLTGLYENSEGCLYFAWVAVLLLALVAVIFSIFLSIKGEGRVIDRRDMIQFIVLLIAIGLLWGYGSYIPKNICHLLDI
jgi:hypothetical protein